MSLPHVHTVVLSGLLAACGVAPKHPGLPTIDPDSGFSASIPSIGGPRADATTWWHRATVPEVSAGLEKSLALNPELNRVDFELASLLAQVTQAESDTGAKLTLDAGAQVNRNDGTTSNSRSIGVDGTAPLDVNGALSQRLTAARQQLLAGEADAEQLKSDLARDYLLALADRGEARQRIGLLEQQLEVASTLLGLIELRFTQGLASSVDVLQQRDQLAALRQQLPIATLDAVVASNRIKQIAGLTPGSDITQAADAIPVIAGNFAMTAPVELVQRRGKLRAAQARIAAADASFAAALADRLPRLDLSGGLLRRVAAGDYSSILTAALDASFALFDGGYSIAVAEQRKAELSASGESLIIDWLDIVAAADNLIQREASLRQRITLSSERLESAEALLIATRRRYERGVSDYLPVLEALRSLQQQQSAHLALRAELARDRIRLHHALGDLASEKEE